MTRPSRLCSSVFRVLRFAKGREGLHALAFALAAVGAGSRIRSTGARSVSTRGGALFILSDIQTVWATGVSIHAGAAQG